MCSVDRHINFCFAPIFPFQTRFVTAMKHMITFRAPLSFQQIFLSPLSLGNNCPTHKYLLTDSAGLDKQKFQPPVTQNPYANSSNVLEQDLEHRRVLFLWDFGNPPFTRLHLRGITDGANACQHGPAGPYKRPEVQRGEIRATGGRPCCTFRR